MNNFIGCSHLKMPTPDGALLIGSKNRPDVGDMLIAVGVLPGDDASAIARHYDGSIAAAKPSRHGAHGVCIKGSAHAFQMHNR